MKTDTIYKKFKEEFTCEGVKEYVSEMTELINSLSSVSSTGVKGPLHPESVMSAEQAPEILLTFQGIVANIYGYVYWHRERDLQASKFECDELLKPFEEKLLLEAFQVFKSKVKSFEFKKDYMLNLLLKQSENEELSSSDEQTNEHVRSLVEQEKVNGNGLKHIPFYLYAKVYFKRPYSDTLYTDKITLQDSILSDIISYKIDDNVLYYKDTYFQVITFYEADHINDHGHLALLPVWWDDRLFETVTSLWSVDKMIHFSLQDAVEASLLIENN